MGKGKVGGYEEEEEKGGGSEWGKVYGLCTCYVHWSGVVSRILYVHSVQQQQQQQLLVSRKSVPLSSNPLHLD